STPLAGAPLQPLEYFRVLNYIRYQTVTALFQRAVMIIHIKFCFVNEFFKKNSTKISAILVATRCCKNAADQALNTF
ncbi:MAG: hypothetical protein LUC95_09100, partial [Lachnospiraceae bacterium]|nr:hypothetical protein [Lachnospiraceae bacterium]